MLLSLATSDSASRLRLPGSSLKVQSLVTLKSRLKLGTAYQAARVLSIIGPLRLRPAASLGMKVPAASLRLPQARPLAYPSGDRRQVRRCRRTGTPSPTCRVRVAPRPPALHSSALTRRARLDGAFSAAVARSSAAGRGSTSKVLGLNGKIIALEG